MTDQFSDQLTEAEAELLASRMDDLSDWCDDGEAAGIPIGNSYSAIMAVAEALRQATREAAH